MKMVLSGLAVVLVTGLIVSLCFIGGCFEGPVKSEQFVKVEPNQTAFLLPLEGDTSKQVKLDSAEKLKARKIAARRISLPLRQHNLGRGLRNYEWIAAAKVVLINRSPVSREWTTDPDTGTSPKDQALRVQSSEGIKFAVGASTCGIVLEDEAYLFAYKFGENARLEEILDQNVRGFAQQLLSEEFGKRTLAQCKAEKNTVFALTEKALQAEFKQWGILIPYFGNSGGLMYDNEKVQASINAEYLQSLEIVIQEKKNTAQAVRNEITVAKAEAARKAALAGYEARGAIMFKNSLEVATIDAEARKTMAGKVSGKLPSTVLPQGGGNMLLQVGK